MPSGFNHVNVLNIGITDQFPSHGSYNDLIHDLGLTYEQITKRILDTFNFKSFITADL